MKYFLPLLILLFYFTLTANKLVPGNTGQDSIAIDKQPDYELKIYPNPIKNGILHLEINSAKIAEIRLINIAGKEVIHRKLESGTVRSRLNLSDVTNGIYFIRVKTTENKVIVKKLVVSSH